MTGSAYLISDKHLMKMNAMTVTVIGATGLVGGQLVDILEKDNAVERIRILSRRPAEFSHSKAELIILDFSNEEEFKAAVNTSDVVFCCVGTTRNKAKGDKEKYRKVDYDIPVNAARFSAESGCSCFVTVSSVGADSDSSNFYLKIKGEVEDAIRVMPIPSVVVMRPSMLLGKRNEFRFGELLGKLLMVPLSFLLPPRIRPIHASHIARAMAEASKNKPSGFHVLHYKEIKDLAESSK